jgi:hypothetical protein
MSRGPTKRKIERGQQRFLHSPGEEKGGARVTLRDRSTAPPALLSLGRVLKKLFVARPLNLTVGRVGMDGTLKAS